MHYLKHDRSIEYEYVEVVNMLVDSKLCEAGALLTGK